MPTKNCAKCGYSKLNAEQCPILGTPIDPDAVCPYFTEELVYCHYCNQIIPEKNYALVHVDSLWKPICRKCLSLSGTCGNCENSHTCVFETNPSPIPKAVQKRIQQGNQIMVVTVKNDARVAETCAKNCECFDLDSNSCNRENNTCGKHKGEF